MVVKAEITQYKLNPRFVVTNLKSLDDEHTYTFYCARGEQENRIKEMKLDLSSGRTKLRQFSRESVQIAAAHCVLHADGLASGVPRRDVPCQGSSRND